MWRKRRQKSLTIEQAMQVSGNPRTVKQMFPKVDENGEYIPHFDIDVDGGGEGPKWIQDEPYPELFEED